MEDYKERYIESLRVNNQLRARNIELAEQVKDLEDSNVRLTIRALNTDKMLKRLLSIAYEITDMDANGDFD